MHACHTRKTKTENGILGLRFVNVARVNNGQSKDILCCFRERQVKSEVVTSSYQSWVYIGDSGFKVIVFLCSAVVLLSVYVIFTKPRLISPSGRSSPSASVKMISKTPNYPTDFRISL